MTKLKPNLSSPMPQGALKEVIGRALALPADDTDTDQIIPARFLRCVTFDNLAEGLFYDQRFQEGQATDHPLNEMEADHKILVVGENFGCGSSREHAPQAILRSGVRAIIGGSFAEIFFGNSAGLGLVCATLEPEQLKDLQRRVQENPQQVWQLDIAAETLHARGSDEAIAVSIRDSARHGFVEGSYDPLASLLQRRELILDRHQRLPGYEGI